VQPSDGEPPPSDEGDAFINEDLSGDSPDVSQALALSIDLAPVLADERALVARAQQGDAGSIETLTRTYFRMVDRMLFRMLGQRADHDDLVQTVFLEMCRSLSRFRNESSFKTFLGGITTIVARRAMRPLAFDRRRAILDDETTFGSDDPEHAAQDRRRIASLHRAIDSLSVDHRVAFTLWALEGLEPAVIAEMTGTTMSAIRSRIFYAQKHLRTYAERDPVLAEWLGGGDEQPR